MILASHSVRANCTRRGTNNDTNHRKTLPLPPHLYSLTDCYVKSMFADKSNISLRFKWNIRYLNQISIAILYDIPWLWACHYEKMTWFSTNHYIFTPLYLFTHRDRRHIQFIYRYRDIFASSLLYNRSFIFIKNIRLILMNMASNAYNSGGTLTEMK